MNILLLGPERPGMISFMKSLGDDVRSTEEKIVSTSELVRWADFLVSYGFRHIIKKKVLDLFPERAINLHISYLPWNRGSDPNLWSYLEDTPKGVTIHCLDRGLDTGDILVQKLVESRPDDTLRTSYDRLADNMEKLFRESWSDIRNGKLAAVPQPEGGSGHRLRDKESYLPLLTRGWDTPVREIIGRALNGEAEKSFAEAIPNKK